MKRYVEYEIELNLEDYVRLLRIGCNDMLYQRRYNTDKSTYDIRIEAKHIERVLSLIEKEIDRIHEEEFGFNTYNLEAFEYSRVYSIIERYEMIEEEEE